MIPACILDQSLVLTVIGWLTFICPSSSTDSKVCVFLLCLTSVNIMMYIRKPGNSIICAAACHTFKRRDAGADSLSRETKMRLATLLKGFQIAP